jgi:hypothetical protein
MDDNRAIKEKLILVIINLIVRSIEEAKKVPYLVEQENLVDILINHPDIYQQMVLEGQLDGGGVPKGKTIVKLDILSELNEFEGLDRFDMTLEGMMVQDDQNSPIFNQINLLSKMFMAYISNIITTFEKSYEQFLDRYRQSMQGMSQKVDVVQITWDDLGEVRQAAESMLAGGEFIQSFSLGRLLDPEVIASNLIHFPSADDSLARLLLVNAPQDVDKFRRLAKFILRASYISHNHWRDIFHVLAELAEQDPQRYHREVLISLIEQDSVFCCNLLHMTYESLFSWTPEDRRLAIEQALTSNRKSED